MFYNNLPAKLTVKDVSKFGKWGRSFSFLKPCLAGSNFLFEQASSKIVSKGVCLLILTVILWPSGQSTFTCEAIFLIENHKMFWWNFTKILQDWLNWRCLNSVCFDFENWDCWWVSYKRKSRKFSRIFKIFFSIRNYFLKIKNEYVLNKDLKYVNTYYLINFFRSPCNVLDWDFGDFSDFVRTHFWIFSSYIVVSTNLLDKTHL